MRLRVEKHDWSMVDVTGRRTGQRGWARRVFFGQLFAVELRAWEWPIRWDRRQAALRGEDTVARKGTGESAG